ncbi:hypothetical protein [Pseudomonas fluorescens]|uniref:hypothetical protein n=1 Tax=Pseudomonas fluorescens TaxID=294 RepID=UPI0009376C48|nr:hypothetical protein [Pseudomonas fluorescens]
MTNKALRILIADVRHEPLLHIEKLLNRLGYYRIAPISSFDELVLLTSDPHQPFDLLIVNKALAVPYGTDIQQFCSARPHIRHVLFYDSPAPSFQPDAGSLSLLMGLIDPPSQWACLKALPWLRAPFGPAPSDRKSFQ